MRQSASTIARGTAVALAGVCLSNPACAQSDYYANKTVRVIVGLAAGGTVDTFARAFSGYLRKHIPGNPTVIVQNMPGAGGKNATNFLAEKAAPDGLTILYGPWDPLAQALGDKNFRARYEKLEYIGGTGDIRVLYARTDAVPGRIKTPADIAKAQNLALGALNPTDISGLLPHLALNVLGIKHKIIMGYRGGSDVFLAMQRGEIQVHSTSITTFRSRNAAFVKSGDGIGIAYLVPVDSRGQYETSKFISEMPAFPELYKAMRGGKMPAGAMWGALNWLTNQTGELTFVGFAPPATAQSRMTILRKAFQAASNDPDFIKESTKRYGLPYTYIGVERGQAVIRSLADVSPSVLETLREVTGVKK
ncbi:MAG: Bug family tripartite tricarboxylate transporter substrate binding protein [Xanthobacteraceae bacterium]